MTEASLPAQSGTVHDLDTHRTTKASKRAVSLVKDPSAGLVADVVSITPATAEPETGSEVERVALWRQSGRKLHAAATDERTRRYARTAFRHTAYVAGGVRITTRRLWDSRTAARYERMIRAAEAAGNAELAKEWEERCRTYRAARHQRRMDLLQLPGKLARAALVGTGTTVGGLLVLGGIMAVATGSWADILTPLMAVVTLIYWLTVIIALVWAPTIVIAPWLVLAGLWSVGRKSQAAPQWALPAAQRTEDAGAPITPSIVVTAMRDLGIPAMRKAIKEMGDHGAAMLGPITIAGCGVELDVLLPSGVSTDEVQSKRRKLAENLARHEHEVFITIPTAARTVRLWIADSGALDEPIGPSPLVLDAEMTASYKTGKAPWGQDLRGDAAQLSLYQRHLLITGMSNQGKTASLRALALWLGLDPTVEFRVADLKGAGDWAMFDGIATTLIQGPTDEHVIEATEMLEAGVAEMEHRLQQPPGTVFTPLILLVDEEQVAFMCPAVDDKKRPYGGSKANSRYFMAARKINNQGRAVDVLLYQGTQDPTDQNLPKLVREGAHTRASLALGTESQARMALGDKAVDGGAAPNLLRPGLDKGTVVLASDGIKIPSGQASITVRTHYISTDDAKQLADRIKDLRGQITTRHEADGEGPEERDHLADLTVVVGQESRVLTQDVLHRLRALSETAYGHWTPGDLKAALEGTGAEPYKSDGRMVISRERLHHALTNRGDEDSASDSE